MVVRALILLLLAGCGAPEAIRECAGVGDFGVICGFRNPEDLAPLPGGRRLLVSQFASMDGSEGGSLTLLDLGRETRRVLFPDPGGGGGGVVLEGPRWGADDCPGPPGRDFAPHGIDLVRRADGALQVLAVNHGGRESVEFFEVLEDTGQAALQWRGCAVPPEDAYLNDVVAMPEGGFATTHMMPRSSQGGSMLKAAFGADTGHVYEWERASGWSKVAGSDAPFPNGIEVSPDGAVLYFTSYLGDEVRAVSRKTGKLIAVAEEITQPDNLTWSADGRRLYVASHVDGFRTNFCTRIEEGACPVAFEILALDPATLAQEVVLAHPGGPPMGAATVALEVGDHLYLGTFAGDRVGRVPIR